MDVSEHRMIMFFIEGLYKPLCGWVKAMKTMSLKDVISRTRDMEYALRKNKISSKYFLPQENKDKKPFQKEWSEKDKFDDKARRELRRKKI